jgi:hypothetical protein
MPQVFQCHTDKFNHEKRTGKHPTYGQFRITGPDIGPDDRLHALSVDLGMI